MNAASHSTLDNEFGTHVEEDVIKQIIEKGTIQESQVTIPSRCNIISNANCLPSFQSERAARMTAWEHAPVTELCTSLMPVIGMA